MGCQSRKKYISRFVDFFWSDLMPFRLLEEPLIVEYSEHALINFIYCMAMNVVNSPSRVWTVTALHPWSNGVIKMFT